MRLAITETNAKRYFFRMNPDARHTEPVSQATRAWRLAEAVLDWLLPRHCLMCGGRSGEENVCPPCRADLPRQVDVCNLCALALEGESGGTCGRCLSRPPPWDHVLAALDYSFPVDVLVQRFKFSRNLACGEVLGQALARAVRDAGPGSTGGYDPPQRIVPVPLHRRRLAKRSFNQAGVVAQFVSRQTGIPVDSRLLSRVRMTHAQSGLDARSRRRNTRGAFHARAMRAADIRHAVLLDDVMTTGATLEACTRELKRVGIGRVTLWVVARAPPP